MFLFCYIKDGDFMKNISALVVGCLVSMAIAFIFMPRSGEIENTMTVMNENNTKVFQLGAYKDEKTALDYASKTNSKVFLNDGYYYVYLSILSDSENIEKMINYLNTNNIDTSTKFQEELMKYEELMKQTSSDIAFIELNKRIMNLYEETYED